MKPHLYVLVLIVSCSLSNRLFAQSQSSFNRLIEATNTYLANYDTLSPFGTETYIALAESSLSKDLVASIMADEEYVDGLSNGRDSITEFNLILELQELIMGNLEQLIVHDRFGSSDIEAIIGDYDLAIVKSDDGKLYNFSLDEKTGGSYRSRLSLMHYTEISRDSLPTQQELDEGTKINPYSIFEGDGFDSIHTLDTEEGIKYVVSGSVRGCSYCFETSVMLVYFADGFFQQDFYYSVNSRDWEEGAYYNPETQTIEVDYMTDDLTYDCDCSNTADEGGYDNYAHDYEDEEMIIKKCHCTFEFNGRNFELVKEGWEKVKE